MEPGQVADLKTVVTEACMNVVVHAYEEEPGPLEVDAYREDDALVVVVRDHGAGIRPRADASRESLRMGLPLIAALSSSFEISGGARAGHRGDDADGALARTAMRRSQRSDADGREPGAAMSMPAGRAGRPGALADDLDLRRARQLLGRPPLRRGPAGRRDLGAGASHFPDGTAHVVVDERGRGAVEVRVGPLVDGGGRAAPRTRCGSPRSDASLERLADDVSVERDGDAEHLLLEIRPQAAS